MSEGNRARAESANSELRESRRDLLPAVLSHGGLPAGDKTLASRMPLPVEVDFGGPLPAAVEATAYFIVAEALSNVAKHAHATHATVHAKIEDGTLKLRCATTAPEAPGPTAPVSSSWQTGSPSATASSESQAEPTAARPSPQTPPPRLTRMAVEPSPGRQLLRGMSGAGERPRLHRSAGIEACQAQRRHERRHSAARSELPSPTSNASPCCLHKRSSRKGWLGSSSTRETVRWFGLLAKSA